MKQYKIVCLFILAIIPTYALAEFAGTIELINAFGGVLDSLFGILVALALLVFFWGLVKFIFRISGDEKAVEDGKRIMKWGLLALFVMVSVWGIIGFIQDDLGLGGGSNSRGSPAPLPAPVGGDSGSGDWIGGY